MAAVARRPRLWPVALRQARRLAAPGWWRRAPFLPVPSRDYVALRALTQYGDSLAPLAAADVVHYLEWCRQWDAV